MAKFTSFLADDRGSTAIEYSLIGGIISIIILASVTSIGSTISNTFINPIGDALN